MVFTLFILIFAILIFIYNKTKTEYVCRYSPANSNYINMVITIYIGIPEVPGKISSKIYINKYIFYVRKNMTHSDIINYIKRHTELYKNELDIIDRHYKKEFNYIPIIKKIAIEIN